MRGLAAACASPSRPSLARREWVNFRELALRRRAGQLGGLAQDALAQLDADLADRRAVGAVTARLRLAAEVAASGALISEFPLSTPPLSQNFPYRNRVLSGLCFGVLVVEAAEHSGSLITARLAAEQGREIFAVPGNITSRNSFGPNYLIKDARSWSSSGAT